MRIEENVSLAEYTTLKVGGPARFFCVAQSLKDVEAAVTFANDKELSIFVLGGGSNILVSDEGYDGLVLKIEIDGIRHKEDGDTVEVTAGAGVVWDELVRHTCEHEWYGLENLSLIPGTVGASVVQNIGAYGVEVGEKVFSVDVFDIQTNEIKKMLHDECNFGYRDSVFKTVAGASLVVLSVTYYLTQRGEMNCEYADVKTYFDIADITNPSIHDVRRAIVAIREDKLPDMQAYGTAGSFFKNPVVSTDTADALQQKFAEAKVFPIDEDQCKISAAWLLETFTDWKGQIKNGVGAYEKHALVLVTTSDANATAVLDCVGDAQKKVFEATAIELEPEVVVVKNKM